MNNHKFRIVDADISVYDYLKDNPEKFPAIVVENVKNHHLKNRHMIFTNEVKFECFVLYYNMCNILGLIIFRKCLKNRMMTFSEILHKILPGEFIIRVYFYTKISRICDCSPKPIDLPAPLQGMECAMTMPEISEEKDESQPIVCLTGPIPDTHNDENVKYYKLDTLCFNRLT